MKKRVLAVFLVLVVALVAFLYFPRGAGALEAINNAVLSVLNGDVDGSRGGADFAPALDGDIFATGDVVRSNDKGRAVLTFFEGSTLSVDPGSRVRVISLVKTGSGGIQLDLEQTAGRTWASVAKLVSPDSKFQIKTPSMTALVRGTAFETIVQRTPDGKTVTTIKTDEGEVVVQAAAGGQVTVPAGTQVDVQQDQPAPPAAQPQPPTPKLRLSSPAGIGFVVIDPRGLQCGSTGGATQRQIPRCEVLGGGGQSVVVGDVIAGVYSLVATAAQAVPDATIVAEGLGIQGTDFTSKIARTMAIGDLVRTTIPVALDAGGKMSSGGFAPPELVTSVCGAESTGHVFSGGGLTERADALVAYAQQQKGVPVAVVYTQAELTQEAGKGMADVSSQAPVTLADVKVTIDNAGIHLTASASAGPLTVPLRADIIAGAQDGKIVLRLRNIDAGPLPPAAKDPIIANLNKGLGEFAATMPLVAERVALRSGCFALIGRTPN